jgi:hypothetical protein
MGNGSQCLTGRNTVKGDDGEKLTFGNRFEKGSRCTVQGKDHQRTVHGAWCIVHGSRKNNERTVQGSWQTEKKVKDGYQDKNPTGFTELTESLWCSPEGRLYSNGSHAI